MIVSKEKGFYGMSENVTNELLLGVLKNIQSSLDRMENDIRDIKFRLTQVEERQNHHTSKIDRVDDRLFRIEKRLDLVDA